MNIIETPRLNPLNDYLFQKLFGEKGDEEQLLAFLNAVLGLKDPLASVEILEYKTLTAEIIGNKESILDVRAVTKDDGRRVNIEVQLKDLHNMAKRSLFYWSREYAKNISAGEDYKELPRVITINIVDFDYIPLDEYHTSFCIRENKHTDYVLTDALEIHFISMTKFRALKEKDVKNNLLERWLSFLDERTLPETIEEIKKMDRTIQKTAGQMDTLLRDPDTLRLYHLRGMGMSDWTSGINDAREEGKIEGKIEGERKEKETTAKNALRKGYPLDEIQDLTGLSVERIRELQASIQKLSR